MCTIVAFESDVTETFRRFSWSSTWIAAFYDTRYRISGNSSHCYRVGMVSSCQAWRDNLPGVQCAGDKFVRQLAPYTFWFLFTARLGLAFIICL